jgi:hypothetical protein
MVCLLPRRFDYIKDSHYFFWRYADVVCRLQGCDLSVSSPTPDSIKQIRDIEQGSRDDNPWDHSWANPEIQTYRQ